MANVFVLCAISSHLHVNIPLFRVVWMCLGIVLITVLKMLQGPVLCSQQWGDELLLCSQTYSLHSEVTGTFKASLSISCLDCYLHSVLEWPRGDMGDPVLSSLGYPVLLAAEGLLELCLTCARGPAVP